MKLEVVVIPVSDVDRAKRFYGGLGLAARRRLRRRRRLSGSCSSRRRARRARSTSARASRRPRRARHADFSRRVRHRGGARRTRRPRRRRERSVPPCRSRDSRRSAARIRSGAATPRSPRSAIRTATSWLLQEVTARLPGRVDADVTTFASSPSSRARCAARRPRTASTRSGPASGMTNWPDWYAAYMVARAGRQPLPS